MTVNLAIMRPEANIELMHVGEATEQTADCSPIVTCSVPVVAWYGIWSGMGWYMWRHRMVHVVVGMVHKGGTGWYMWWWGWYIKEAQDGIGCGIEWSPGWYSGP